MTDLRAELLRACDRRSGMALGKASTRLYDSQAKAYDELQNACADYFKRGVVSENVRLLPLLLALVDVAVAAEHYINTVSIVPEDNADIIRLNALTLEASMLLDRAQNALKERVGR